MGACLVLRLVARAACVRTCLVGVLLQALLHRPMDLRPFVCITIPWQHSARMLGTTCLQHSSCLWADHLMVLQSPAM